MSTILIFDIKNYFRQIPTYIVALLLCCFGWFAGSNFNLSVGKGVYLNSPYTTGFMLGLLSLSIVFIATVTGTQLLFKEWDARFNLLLFSTTITKKQFTSGRFLSFYLITLTGFLLLAVGFMFGQSVRSGTNMQQGFQLTRYAYPFLLFACVNTFFVCSVLSVIAWLTKNKLLVAVSGIMLYIFYMITLLFSGSPFMAQSIPNSVQAQQISALADPFGLSPYFFVSKHFSVVQRNTNIVPLTGVLLINRLLVITVSCFLLLIGRKYFSITAAKTTHKKREAAIAATTMPVAYKTAIVAYSSKQQIRAVLSFLKTDLIYIFKGIPVIIAAILLLFNLGMEMYAEIEKGIRLPQKYASSGLMASTILENLHLPCVLLVLYYANDLYWRSSIARFSMLENTTAFSASKYAGNWLSSSVLIFFLTALSIIAGLIFQVGYHYPHIEWKPYAGVLLFNSMPLVLLAGFVLLLNRLIPNKYVALGVTLIIAIVTASPLAAKFISNPLLRFFTAFRGVYSDFNGYGNYTASFLQRLLFGFAVIIILWQIARMIQLKKYHATSIGVLILLIPASIFFASKFLNGYLPTNKQQALEWAADYEKQYRKYQTIAQPVITDVNTQVHLFPSANRYIVEGSYLLKNNTTTPIQKILLCFNNDLKIDKAQFATAFEIVNIIQHNSEIILKQALAPNDSARLNFTISYSWQPVNGHKSFNAIIQNGSFMRISRYYPQIGYQPGYELADTTQRKQFGLGAATSLKKVEEERTPANDFINLEMTIDTEQGQTAVGSGELIKQWMDNGRNYFQYKTPAPVPFRFAVSSANYQVTSILHQGIKITVLYHPKHTENVAHLISNARLTLDYCQHNFGVYPYKSVTFAEVSSFTRGFAATAYPATIFMTEDMVFHANIKADEQQDVINELAGHELAHLWWGDHQMAPDEREGAAMLTESLAMYTEMMLYKKMYGKEKMMQRIKMHQQIYDAEKGFTTNEPLYKVTNANTHISYSKGAVVMVQLSELIGEATVNKALRQLLKAVKQSAHKPVSIDCIDALLQVSDKQYHHQIKKLLMQI
jgi:ABC-2 type transport system permease protein